MPPARINSRPLLADALASAFPSDETCEEAAVSTALRAVVPPPAFIPFDRLIAEASQHRLLLMRSGYAIPLEALVALGGALFFHLLILGLFLTGMYYALNVFPRMVSDGGRFTDSGGAPESYLLSDSASPGDPSPNLPGQAAQSVLPPALPLPRLPDQITSPNQIALQQLAPQLLPATLGVPTNSQPLGQVNIRPPQRPAASAGTLAAGDGGFGDEPSFTVGKPGDSGAGAGGRGGRGSGVGPSFGPSGANFPEPRVLDNPMPEHQPMPKKPVTLEIQVLASGQIGNIKILETSGEADVDEFFRKVVSNWKFYPAIIAGKPVTETTKITLGPMRE